MVYWLIKTASSVKLNWRPVKRSQNDGWAGQVYNVAKGGEHLRVAASSPGDSRDDTQLRLTRWTGAWQQSERGGPVETIKQ